MGRPRKRHPGQPKEHKGRDRIWWLGRWWDLGTANTPESRAEYNRLAAVWAADPAAVPLPKDAYLVSALCADYALSADCPAGKRQAARVATAVELLMDHHRHREAAAFGPTDLRAWQRHLCTIPDPKDPARTRFNVTTVCDLVGAVCRVFKWGVSTGRVAEPVYRALLTVPPPKFGEARPVRDVLSADPAHVTKTLPHLRGPVRAMVELEWHTGARPDELCRMTAGDVVRSGRVELPGIGLKDLDAANVWVYVVLRHKTAWKGKHRILFFAGRAKEVLMPFLDRPADAYCFSPRETVAELRAAQQAEREARGGGGNRKAPAAAPRPLSDHYTPRTYRQAVERACVRAGVPHWFPYSLRHLAASEIKATDDLEAVMSLLGHHTKSMAEHYGGRSFERAAEVARKRGRANNAVGGGASPPPPT